ncbi:MAG: carboxylesterase family protein [Solirubrobacterales bacterium]
MPGPQIETAEGLLVGVAGEQCDRFCGVPFAAPPTGARRFGPPAPKRPWTGVRDATRFGPAAPQPERPISLAMHGPTPLTDEACLSLNLWLPREAPRPLPVLVWIHGGGWAMGFGSQGAIIGPRLAAAGGCAVITFNYRLGSLGWLAHPGLAAEPGAPAANWGLQDQVAALGWLRDNAAALGLDPAKVTIAGQSAGALSVVNLLVSPLAAGLFRRAVVQSAPLRDSAIEPHVAARWAEQLCEELGASGFDLEALRGASAERIVAAHEAVQGREEWRGTRGGALPTLDPATLPARVLDDPGLRPEVDVLIGHTSGEGSFRMLGDPKLELTAAQIEKGTEARFAAPISAFARERAAAGCRVFGYRVDLPALDPRLGATHGVDVPLVFGTYGADPSARRLVGDGPRTAAAAAAMMDAWGRFVRGEEPGWSPLEPAGGEIAIFGEPATGMTKEEDAWRAKTAA